jgi:drug/metabolite transporter (DMT)-like permease
LPASRRSAVIKAILVLTMLVWGGSFIASSIGLDGLYPVELATFRFVIAVPILLIFTILFKGVGSLKIDLKDLPVLVVMALTGVSLQYISQFIGMTYTTVTNTALLINMGAIYVVLGSALILKEKIGIDNIFGVFLAFIGAVFVATKGNFAFEPHLLGDIMIMFCALMWAVYIMTGTKLAGKYSVLTQLNYIFIIGLILLLPVYAVTPHHAIEEITSLTWACLLYLAIVCSVIAYFIFNYAIISIGPSQTAIYQYFEPLFAIVFAILLLSEPFTLIIGIGALLIIIGVAMADNNLKLIGHFIRSDDKKASGQNEH